MKTNPDCDSSAPADLRSALSECLQQLQQMADTYDHDEGRIAAVIELAEKALAAAQVSAPSQGPAARIIELLNRYGKAKFGDEWWPGNASRYLPEAEAAELNRLLS